MSASAPYLHCVQCPVVSNCGLQVIPLTSPKSAGHSNATAAAPAAFQVKYSSKHMVCWRWMPPLEHTAIFRKTCQSTRIYWSSQTRMSRMGLRNYMLWQGNLRRYKVVPHG